MNKRNNNRRKFKDFVEENERYKDRGVKKNEKKSKRNQQNKNLRDFVSGGLDEEDLNDYFDEETY